MINRPTAISDDDLHALVDGHLSAARQAEVEAWLADHPEVAAKVAGYRAQRAAIRDAFDPVLDEPVPSSLNLRTLKAGRARSPQGWRSMAAAALLIGGSVGGWFAHDWIEPPNRGIGLLAREAAASYAVYAPDQLHPIEISADDRGELDRWISTRIGHKVAAPDLRASGFALMGGRLVSTSHGPAGLFLYSDGAGTRVAMLVRPMEVDKVAALHENSIDGTQGRSWAENGIGFSLVGPASLTNIGVLAGEARRQAGL